MRGLIVAVVLLAGRAGAQALPCPPEPALAGEFWLVQGEPLLCVSEPLLAPYRALPSGRRDVVQEIDASGAWRARVRWSAVAFPATESAPSQPWKELPAGVAPDADGNGIVTALDFPSFVWDFVRGDPGRFDFDGNGSLNAADFSGFRDALGGQVLR